MRAGSWEMRAGSWELGDRRIRGGKRNALKRAN